eukprot:3338328-Rhodomonas_salina.1
MREREGGSRRGYAAGKEGVGLGWKMTWGVRVRECVSGTAWEERGGEGEERREGRRRREGGGKEKEGEGRKERGRERH